MSYALESSGSMKKMWCPGVQFPQNLTLQGSVLCVACILLLCLSHLFAVFFFFSPDVCIDSLPVFSCACSLVLVRCKMAGSEGA